MKLLYISNQRLPTEKAYGIQITNTCEAFVKNGLSVELLLPYRQNLIKQDLFSFYGINQNFSVKKIWSPDFYLPGRLDSLAVRLKFMISGFRLASYAKKIKTDIIYSRDEWPIYFLSFSKSNLVFEAHTFSSTRPFFYKRFLDRKIKLIVISEELKKSFVDFGFNKNNILVAHDGVDLSLFDVEISKEEARAKTGLDGSRPIVLYSGHLFPWKGSQVLAKASQNLPEVNFVFVGGTDRDIMDFKNKFGGHSNIIILGRRPHSEIPLFLKAADILVLPNTLEDSKFTSPLKLFEYMASHRPIIASKIPSISEVLDESSSILIKPDDPEALRIGIDRLLGDKGLADNLSSSAFKLVMRFTWLERTKRIKDFIT